MEEVKTNFYKGVRGYERLNDGSRKSRRKSSRVELGADGSSRKRMFWKIRFTPRLKLKLRRSSLRKLLIKLRDGYVNTMMKLANSRFLSGGVPWMGGDGGVGFGARPIKEYDQKMIVEIYKSIVMAHGIVPMDAAKVTSSHLTVTSSSSAVTN